MNVGRVTCSGPYVVMGGGGVMYSLSVCIYAAMTVKTFKLTEAFC